METKPTVQNSGEAWKQEPGLLDDTASNAPYPILGREVVDVGSPSDQYGEGTQAPLEAADTPRGGRGSAGKFLAGVMRRVFEPSETGSKRDNQAVAARAMDNMALGIRNDPNRWNNNEGFRRRRTRF